MEDFQPYRLFVAQLLRRQPHFQVAAEAADGLEAVEKARLLRPDLVLMDIGIPQLNGIDAARRIREESPDIKVVFLTQETAPEVVEEALGIGAHGFVFKSVAQEDLVPALEAAMNGVQFVSGRGGNGR